MDGTLAAGNADRCWPGCTPLDRRTGIPLWTAAGRPDLADTAWRSLADPRLVRLGRTANGSAQLLRDAGPRSRDWTARYHRLAARPDRVPWVPTHGEPHTANQLITQPGRSSWTGRRWP